MTQEQRQTILEQHLKGVNINIIWTLIVCTAVSVGSVLSAYYGFKNEQDKTNMKIDKVNMRVDFLKEQFDNEYNKDKQK